MGVMSGICVDFKFVLAWLRWLDIDLPSLTKSFIHSDKNSGSSLLIRSREYKHTDNVT